MGPSTSFVTAAPPAPSPPSRALVKVEQACRNPCYFCVDQVSISPQLAVTLPPLSPPLPRQSCRAGHGGREELHTVPRTPGPHWLSLATASREISGHKELCRPVLKAPHVGNKTWLASLSFLWAAVGQPSWANSKPLHVSTVLSFREGPFPCQ